VRVSRLVVNFEQFGGMGERLIFKVLGNEWNDSADIEEGDSVKPFLDYLQLGSASIDVGHSEGVFMLAEW